MTRFWLVRHGPTHAKAMAGWTDLPADLSDHAGIARLAAGLPPGAPVISSDLSRAVATADAVAPTHPRLPPDPALREIHFGAWEGHTHDQLAADPHHAPLLRAFWEVPGETRPPNGESWNDMRARVRAALDRLEGVAEDVIVICHFGPILAAIQDAADLSTEAVFAHRIDPLSLTRLSFGPHGGVDLINHKP